MGKSVGIIGNFSGKLGNAVGFKNSASNDGRTQGVRIYQPVVKNPKSYAQAQQRMRMLPVNNTYRLLKDIIDRGQEGVAYGNKSRLAWLKKAMKNFNGPYQQKGSSMIWPMLIQITNGSLPEYPIGDGGDHSVELGANAAITTAPTTVAGLYSAIKLIYPSLSEGDQMTIVTGSAQNWGVEVHVDSFVLTSNDDTAVSGFSVDDGELFFDGKAGTNTNFATVIISREGTNGAHLRSKAVLTDVKDLRHNEVYEKATSEAAAIRSYMTEGSNVDWPQEEISPNLQ